METTRELVLAESTVRTETIRELVQAVNTAHTARTRVPVQTSLLTATTARTRRIWERTRETEGLEGLLSLGANVSRDKFQNF